MFEHPYNDVFKIIFWFIPILTYYFLRKYPEKYKLPKCYIIFLVTTIPVYFLVWVTYLTVFMDINKYPFNDYALNKYLLFPTLITYIISSLIASGLCFKHFKEESKKVRLDTKLSCSGALIKNKIILGLISIFLLAICLYISSEMFMFKFIFIYPILGILFFLHFNPEIKNFLEGNVWFFITLCIFFLFMLFTNKNYSPYVSIILLNIFTFASLILILLHDSYLIKGKPLYSKKSYLFVLLFILPFLFADDFLPVWFGYAFYKITDITWTFSPYTDSPAYTKVTLIIIAVCFSYYWFLKLKKNILIEQSELDLEREKR